MEAIENISYDEYCEVFTDYMDYILECQKDANKDNRLYPMSLKEFYEKFW